MVVMKVIQPPETFEVEIRIRVACGYKPSRTCKRKLPPYMDAVIRSLRHSQHKRKYMQDVYIRRVI